MILCKILSISLFCVTVWRSSNGGCPETGEGFSFLILNHFYLLCKSNREALIRSILTCPLNIFLYMFIFKNFHHYDKITRYFPCISWGLMSGFGIFSVVVFCLVFVLFCLVFCFFFCLFLTKSHSCWEPCTKSITMKLTCFALYHVILFWYNDFICYHSFRILFTSVIWDCICGLLLIYQAPFAILLSSTLLSAHNILFLYTHTKTFLLPNPLFQHVRLTSTESRSRIASEIIYVKLLINWQD